MKITAKQREVLDCIRHENPKILICSGAKRSGKTWILIYCFIGHISKYENKNMNFIIGGTTQSSIRRNILNELEVILGREIKLSKDGHFNLFGNKVYCFDGANSNSYKKVRGFTSSGALLNEATTLHDTFIKEAISRCSNKGSRIFLDTNPENPNSTIKVDYIDKSGQRLKSGLLNIKAFHFTIFDNTFLDAEYVDSIIASTPSGMFTDRDIYGLWVASEGVIYKDFHNDLFIDDIEDINFVKFIGGVDWGYSHFGSIVVIGIDSKDNYYLIEEYAEQYKEIEYWVDIAKDIKERYGNIPFYCDSARSEYVARFQREHLRAFNGRKDVIGGISEIAKLMKEKRFYVYRPKVKRFNAEIYNYVWKTGADEPVKENDDVLDSIRYGIFSHITRNKINVIGKHSLF